MGRTDRAESLTPSTLLCCARCSLLQVNKQGQTRLAQYYEWLTIAEKSSLEGEIIRKCLARNESQCSFLEYRNYKCIYRRYASLFFIVGVDSDEVRGNTEPGARRKEATRREEREAHCVLSLSACRVCCVCLCHQNELAVLEFIHNLVETLDKYFENVCELDVRSNTHPEAQHNEQRMIAARIDRWLCATASPCVCVRCSPLSRSCSIWSARISFWMR